MRSSLTESSAMALIAISSVSMVSGSRIQLLASHSSSFAVVRPIVPVAGGAGRVQWLVQVQNGLHIFFLSRFKSCLACIDHELRILHPLVLIPCAAADQQQIPGFGQSERRAANDVPVMIVFRRVAFDIKQRIGGRINDVDH